MKRTRFVRNWLRIVKYFQHVAAVRNLGLVLLFRESAAAFYVNGEIEPRWRESSIPAGFGALSDSKDLALLKI